MSDPARSYDTIVVGGGQAGLATGYYLQENGGDFVILDIGERIGDCWRNRWDSLRPSNQRAFEAAARYTTLAKYYAMQEEDSLQRGLDAAAARYSGLVGVWLHETKIAERG